MPQGNYIEIKWFRKASELVSIELNNEKERINH